MFRLVLILVLAVFASFGATGHAAGTRVTFDESGIARIDGKPFFPIGVYTYEINGSVMADLMEKRFNTVVGIFEPGQLDLIASRGMKAVCPTGPKWLEAATTHPALLGWYLVDEPEGHGHTPAGVHEAYLKVKQRDPYHPIGLCHFLFDAIAQFKDGSDFTMTDVYPVTANRDVPLRNIGVHIDQTRAIHGKNWPNWAYIQDFGGPKTDGGKWAQPLPHEVRAMTWIALAHRAQGILYFSYWPQAPATWASIGTLNRELERIVPWLTAPGRELATRTDKPQVHARARRTATGGILITVNTEPNYVETEILVEGLKKAELRRPLESGRPAAQMKNGRLRERFAPYEEHVYTWGEEPRVNLAGYR